MGWRKHVPPFNQGRGWVTCDRSGGTFPAQEMVWDERGGRVHRSYADVTPGYGTMHPRDLPPPIYDADPKPIPNARPAPDVDDEPDALPDAQRLAALKTSEGG